MVTGCSNTTHCYYSYCLPSMQLLSGQLLHPEASPSPRQQRAGLGQPEACMPLDTKLASRTLKGTSNV